MIKLHQLISLACILAMLIAGCTLDVSNSSSDSFTEDDLLAARQIIGSTLSTDNSGVVLSINDAVDIISETDAPNNKTPKTLLKTDGGNGNEFNYQSEFNSDTKMFEVSFQREIQGPLFQKDVSNELTYLYKDDVGQAIENPTEKSKEIRSINFTVENDGKHQSLSNSFTFNSQDTLLIAGYNESPVSVEGTGSTNGKIQINQPDGSSIERSYKLQLSLIDIKFEKPVELDSVSTSLAVKGNMNFKLVLNQKKSPITIKGTLKMNGDGTALLKFQNSTGNYVVNLKTGDTKNLNNAFLGEVASVNPDQQKITLASGITLFINENTNFLNLEYKSLVDVNEELESNVSIWADGSGQIGKNRFDVDQISFNEGRLDNYTNNEIITFDEFVTDVQPQERRLTLGKQGGKQVELQLLDSTSISDFGDYESLEKVSEGLSNGNFIKVKGKAIGGSAILTVYDNTSVTFKRYKKSN